MERVAARRYTLDRRRWWLCGLLLAGTVINYIDRQMIGILKPLLQGEFGWSETGYANIVFVFQCAYAFGYLSFGALVDRFGAKLGLMLSMLIWNIGHVAHAFARSIFGFSVARAVLGVGEAGFYPGALRIVADWFPDRERALAAGLVFAGANVGAIITPLLVPALTIAFGWRSAFVVTGGFGVLWLIAWSKVHRRDAPDQSTAATADVPALPPRRLLLGKRQTWAYAAPKFMVDPIWWMFLFWLPDFFAKNYHLDLKSFGPPLVVIYISADLGSVAGGWLSYRLIRFGWTLNAARKTALLLSALLVVPITLAAKVHALWTAVALLSLATAGHQAFVANLSALPADLFPRRAVGSVSGIGGAAGAIGGMIMAQYVGWVLQTVGSYQPIFAACALMYLLALLIIHLLAPRLAPLDEFRLS